MKSKLIGDRAFYRRALMFAVPIMIQNGITNFVNMLDNLMVGTVGTEAVTGVAVANQLVFIFNLCIFGAVSGAGIFTAQFHGKGDIKGVQYTFRFKLAFSVLISLLFCFIVYVKGDYLLGLYLKGEGTAETAKMSAEIARDYILIMLIGVIPYAISQSYGATLRETDRPKVPMYAGITAVLVNLVLNYTLIFGHFGFARMGAQGAAVATVASRFVELIYVTLSAHIGKKSAFIVGIFKSLYIPIALIKKMIIKGAPLLINEFLWSLGIAFINQCYSLRGLSVVAGVNIALTFFNVFSVVFMSVGLSIGIIVGQMLGSGKTDEAMDTAVKMRAFSVFTGVTIGILFALSAGVIPNLYNTTDEVKYLAKWFMILWAMAMPIDAFAHSSYFTLRSGGKVLITLVFDSFFVWIVSVPFAFFVSRYTNLPILPFFALSEVLNILKCVLGYIYVKKGSWIKNLTAES